MDTQSVQGMGVFSKVLLTAWEPTLPPVQWVNRLGRETDHCDVSSAEAKNEWSYTVTPPPIPGRVKLPSGVLPPYTTKPSARLNSVLLHPNFCRPEIPRKL